MFSIRAEIIALSRFALPEQAFSVILAVSDWENILGHIAYVRHDSIHAVVPVRLRCAAISILVNFWNCPHINQKKIITNICLMDC